MEFNTLNLICRLLLPSTKRDFVKLYQCPKVMRCIAEPLTTARADRTFENALIKNAKNDLVQKVWEIRLNKVGAFVGIMMAKDNGNSIEVGIMLAREYQGKNYPFEALGKLIAYLEDNRDVKNFTGYVNVRNRPASKLLISLGFKEVLWDVPGQKCFKK